MSVGYIVRFCLKTKQIQKQATHATKQNKTKNHHQQPQQEAREDFKHRCCHHGYPPLINCVLTVAKLQNSPNIEFWDFDSIAVATVTNTLLLGVTAHCCWSPPKKENICMVGRPPTTKQQQQ